MEDSDGDGQFPLVFPGTSHALAIVFELIRARYIAHAVSPHFCM